MNFLKFKGFSFLPILLCVSFLSNYDHTHFYNSNPKEEWEKISDSNDEIAVFERWVEIKEGRSVRERKGEFSVRCTAEQALNVIENVEKTPDWMTGVKEAFRLEQPAEQGFYVYTLYKVPWPFSDRDLISHYKKTTDDQNGQIIINISSNSSLIPKKKNVHRMEEYTAQWNIQRISANEVKIVFTAISHEAPPFPRWMMDPVLKKIFTNNLSNLKQLILNQQE